MHEKTHLRQPELPRLVCAIVSIIYIKWVFVYLCCVCVFGGAFKGLGRVRSGRCALHD